MFFGRCQKLGVRDEAVRSMLNFHVLVKHTLDIRRARAARG